MTDSNKVEKAVATITDGSMILTVEGILKDTTEWRLLLEFKAMPSLSRSWTIRECFYDEEDVDTFVKEEFLAIYTKYLETSYEVESVDCDHENGDLVFENEDGKDECDRCGVIKGAEA